MVLKVLAVSGLLESVEKERFKGERENVISDKKNNEPNKANES